jgi:hypothetical protein
MFGNNFAGEGVILGAGYVQNQEEFIAKNAEKYAETPVFDINIVPRGFHVHVGNGVWMKRCNDCNDYMLSYGTPFIMDFARHEASHGRKVAGVNVPLFSK